MPDAISKTVDPCSISDFPALATEHAAISGARRITEVHLHHTWRPTQAGFEAAARRTGDRIAAGRTLVDAMKRDHVENRGFIDIAQHVSIAPDGLIWLGRNWNLPPASAKGFNGSRTAGPFMIEMIGDFDTGREAPTKEQKNAALTVIASIQKAWGLEPDRLRFHNEMSSKSCPGSSQDKARWIEEIANWKPPSGRASSAASTRKDPPLPGGAPMSSRGPSRLSATFWPAIAAPDESTRSITTFDEELPEHSMPFDEQLRLSDEAFADGSDDNPDGARGLFGDDELDPVLFAKLRPHVINLDRGRFEGESAADRFWSNEDTVRQQLLGDFAKWARQMAATDRIPRLMVWAHGGLVSEKSALQFAARDIDTWKANGVWPLFFVWETGAFETLAQRREERNKPGARGWFTDELWEEIASALGSKLWDAMKSSAFAANDPAGGATFSLKIVKEVQTALQSNNIEAEVHLVGHSAGAIFHTYFWRNCLDAGLVPKSVQFLAPAVRVDVFKPSVLDHVASGFSNAKPPTSFRLFAMTDQLERKDWTMNKVGYGRSILYAVSESFESGRPVRLLGMEKHVRADPQLTKLFGLAGAAGRAKAIFSVTSGAPDHEASKSRTHGFDNDETTIHAVALHILGEIDRSKLTPFDRRKSKHFVEDTVPAPVTKRAGAGPKLSREGWVIDPPAPSDTYGAASPQTSPTSYPAAQSSGGRRALCIGIDNYEGSISKLGGCVNDAKAWGRLLQQSGFGIEYLLNEQASRAGMERAIETFLRSGRSGDVLTLQYSGHGTYFKDENNDEQSGEDQAFVPVDADREGCLLDDDFYDLVRNNLPSGVRLVGFFDCCHSGSITRVAAARASIAGEVNTRFAAPTPGMWARYRNRAERGIVKKQATFLSFSACKDREVALESAGAGHFTRVATSILQTDGALTGAKFFAELRRGFEQRGYTTQNPQMDGPADFFLDELPF